MVRKKPAKSSATRKPRTAKKSTHPHPQKKNKSKQTKYKLKKNVSRKKRTKKSTKNKKLVRLKKQKRKKKQTLIHQIVITAIISSIILCIISYFTIRIPKMEGYAMTATLTDNDRVLVTRWGNIKRFTLIYFRHPETKHSSIRRVIGLPEEELYYKNDELYINNKLIPERFLEASISEAKQSGFLLTQDFTLDQMTGESYIPKGKYFVMGDNRSFSTDSRNYGYVDEKDIIGVVR